MEKDFGIFYQAELEPELLKLERSRKKAAFFSFLNRVVLFAGMVIFLSIFLGILQFMFCGDNFTQWIRITAMAMFLGVLAIALFITLKSSLKTYFIEHKVPLAKKNSSLNLLVFLLLIPSLLIPYYLGGLYLGIREGNYDNSYILTLLPRYGIAFAITFIFFILAKLLALPKRAYDKLFKENILKKVLLFIDKDILFNSSACIPKADFIASNLFEATSIYRYQGSDLVSGLSGKTSYRFSNLEVMKKEVHKTAKGSETEISQVFKGVFFISDFNKNFSGKTAIFPDSMRQLFGENLGESINRLFSTTSFQLVKLEDVEFEKKFAVYANDQTESRYILSTSLMERITRMSAKIGWDVYMAFSNNHLYIAVSSESELLAPAVFRKLTNYSTIEDYYHMICHLTGIVEELNLNTRIWNKA
jgi:hypothetical protein